MSKKIQMRGKYSDKFMIVDDENYEELSKYNWSVKKSKYTLYAEAKIIGWAHRYIMRNSLRRKQKYVIDHINGNGLDNRKENLRVCKSAQNCRNRRVIARDMVIYKGVIDTKTSSKPFISQIGYNRKTIYLGVFKTQEEAAACYNRYASKYFKDYARLNEIKDT